MKYRHAADHPREAVATQQRKPLLSFLFLGLFLLRYAPRHLEHFSSYAGNRLPTT
ncbi:MAG: hypothetical protein GY731_12355 [Gammaproteobacteria bacterium]|nr:hypothetical protein [Gammaproteobacteria bacterium]